MFPGGGKHSLVALVLICKACTHEHDTKRQSDIIQLYGWNSNDNASRYETNFYEIVRYHQHIKEYAWTKITTT